MTEKYKLTKETKQWFGITLYQIEALTDFGNIEKGKKGGWIEKEENLSQEDNCWVYDNACVSGNARVYDNACVYGDACVYDNACVYGDAWVYDNACVSGDACVYGDAWVYGNARVYKKIKLIGGYFYHTKQKSEKIEMVDTYDDDYETLACNPQIEQEKIQKQELLNKANELILKAEELKKEAEKF